MCVGIIPLFVARKWQSAVLGLPGIPCISLRDVSGKREVAGQAPAPRCVAPSNEGVRSNPPPRFLKDGIERRTNLIFCPERR